MSWLNARRLLADDYNALVDYIGGEDRVIFGAGFAGRIEKIIRTQPIRQPAKALTAREERSSPLPKPRCFCFLTKPTRQQRS